MAAREQRRRQRVVAQATAAVHRPGAAGERQDPHALLQRPDRERFGVAHRRWRRPGSPDAPRSERMRACSAAPPRTSRGSAGARSCSPSVVKTTRLGPALSIEAFVPARPSVVHFATPVRASRQNSCPLRRFENPNSIGPSATGVLMYIGRLVLCQICFGVHFPDSCSQAIAERALTRAGNHEHVTGEHRRHDVLVELVGKRQATRAACRSPRRRSRPPCRSSSRADADPLPALMITGDE